MNTTEYNEIINKIVHKYDGIITLNVDNNEVINEFIVNGIDKIRNHKIFILLLEYMIITSNRVCPGKLLKYAYNLLNLNYSLSPSPFILDDDFDKINKYQYYKSLYRTTVVLMGNKLISNCNSEDAEKSRSNKLLYRIWVADK